MAGVPDHGPNRPLPRHPGRDLLTLVVLLGARRLAVLPFDVLPERLATNALGDYGTRARYQRLPPGSLEPAVEKRMCKGHGLDLSGQVFVNPSRLASSTNRVYDAFYLALLGRPQHLPA